MAGHGPFKGRRKKDKVQSDAAHPAVKGSISAEEAEDLFAKVDETGHTNEETARRERSRRSQGAHGVDVDPLSGEDPSGSNVGRVMNRTATIILVVFFVSILLLQVSCGVARRVSTESLANEANVSTVAAAMNNGVEWGNGFTQFPEDFSVQEADENTHRIEVSVTDTSSSDVLGVFSSSQIQAAALSVNALLNPNINTVIYNVNVHVNKNGRIQTSQLFGYLKPTGELKTLMTFIWTKTTTEEGVRFNCTITGVDAETEEQLRSSISTGIIDTVFGDAEDADGSSSLGAEESGSPVPGASEEDAGDGAAGNSQDAEG